MLLISSVAMSFMYCLCFCAIWILFDEFLLSFCIEESLIRIDFRIPCVIQGLFLVSADYVFFSNRGHHIKQGLVLIYEENKNFMDFYIVQFSLVNIGKFLNQLLIF